MFDVFGNILTPPSLRPYQEEIVVKARVAAASQQGNVRLILQGETGSGKSAVAAKMICSAYEKGKKSLFIARGRTLVNQMEEHLKKCNLPVGVIMAGKYPSCAPVQVGSKDTICSRWLRNGNWDSFPDYDLCIQDECHDQGQEWLRLIEKFRVSIGLTATPAKANGEGLGAPWKGLVCCTAPSKLIRDGYLVPSRVFAPHIPDLRKIKKNKDGDFAPKDLARRMDRTSLVGDIVLNWKKYAEGRPTVVFAVTKEHARHIQNKFIEAGIRASYVDDQTCDAERESIFDMTENGFNSVIVNVMVMSRGVDIPCISCIVLARPTNSFVLYRQAIGRGKRPHESKDDLLVIDHAGAVFRHGMPDEDVDWRLGVTHNIQEEQEKKRTNGKMDPIWCPQCHAMFTGRAICPNCGFLTSGAKTRKVKQGHGLLVEVEEVAKPTEHEEKLRYWKKCLFSISHRGGNFLMARAMFRTKYKEWPNKMQPMPPEEQWKAKIEEVYPWTNRRKTA